MQALGRTEDAVILLEAAVRAGGAAGTVRVRWAVLLMELHQEKEAESILDGIVPATPEEAKWKSYGEGRLLLRRDQPAPALRIFEGIQQEREHLPESLLAAAAFGATEARVALHGSEA